MTIKQDKTTLRAKMRTQRKMLFHSPTHADLSAKVCAVLNDAMHGQHGAVVASYSAIGSEVDLTAFHAGVTSHALCLPVVQDGSRILAFHPYTAGMAMTGGMLNTHQPEALARPVMPSVVLLPVLAFDTSGGRLGQGGGYYDATLQALCAQGQKPTLIGVAFAFQEVAAVPRERHDVLLDAIATQDGIRYV